MSNYIRKQSINMGIHNALPPSISYDNSHSQSTNSNQQVSSQPQSVAQDAANDDPVGRYRQLELEFVRLKFERAQLQSDVEERRHSRQRCEDELKVLKDRMHTATTERDRLRSERLSLSEKRDMLRSDLERVSKERNDYKKLLESVRKKKEEQEVKFLRIKKDIDEMKDKSKKSQEEIEKLKEEARDLSKVKVDIKMSSNKIKQERDRLLLKAEGIANEMLEFEQKCVSYARDKELYSLDATKIRKQNEIMSKRLSTCKEKVQQHEKNGSSKRSIVSGRLPTNTTFSLASGILSNFKTDMHHRNNNRPHPEGGASIGSASSDLTDENTTSMPTEIIKLDRESKLF